MFSLPWARARCIAVAGFTSIAVVACDNPERPVYDLVTVHVSVSGSDIDESFEIRWAASSISVTANASSTVRLPRGPNTIELAGVADNCIVEGPEKTSIDVGTEDSAKVVFNVACAATGITIDTRTGGLDIPSLFQLVIPSVKTASVGANDHYSVSRMAAGRYQVRLSIAAPHCSVIGDSIVAVDVVNRQMTAVTFNVRCIVEGLTGAIAYVDGANLFIRDLDSANARQLVRGWNPSWSRDGTKIVYSLTECDYYSYECTGSLAFVDILSREVTLLTNSSGYNPDWSPTDDVIAYSDAATARLHLYDVATGTTTMLDTPNMLAFHPSWSPDGKKLVAQCFSPGAQPPRLCVMNRDGSDVTFLTTGQYSAEPVWSPDGSRIVFVTVGSSSMVNVINSDGSGLRAIVGGYSPSWAPDSRHIIFWDGSGLFTISDTGLGLRRVTSGRHFSPSWRP
ncbi:MAG TPA: hypothetical protein VF042_12960 [Gemmatimonadaceae bacterium]